MATAQTSLRIVIEGPNYAGKSSAGSQLHLLLPGSTVIQLHDFCHQHIIRQSHTPIKLMSRDDYRALDPSLINESLEYLQSRTRHVLQMFDALPNDDIIIERLCLTQFVYSQLLLGINRSKELQQTDTELANRKAFLILINAESQVLLSRARNMEPKGAGCQDYGIPYHLTEDECFKEKCILYDQAFHQMNKTPKVRIDTTSMNQEQLNLEIQKAVEKAISLLS